MGTTKRNQPVSQQPRKTSIHLANTNVAWYLSCYLERHIVRVFTLTSIFHIPYFMCPKQGSPNRPTLPSTPLQLAKHDCFNGICCPISLLCLVPRVQGRQYWQQEGVTNPQDVSFYSVLQIVLTLNVFCSFFFSFIIIFLINNKIDKIKLKQLTH